MTPTTRAVERVVREDGLAAATSVWAASLKSARPLSAIANAAAFAPVLMILGMTDAPITAAATKSVHRQAFIDDSLRGGFPIQQVRQGFAAPVTGVTVASPKDGQTVAAALLLRLCADL